MRYPLSGNLARGHFGQIRRPQLALLPVPTRDHAATIEYRPLVGSRGDGQVGILGLQDKGPLQEILAFTYQNSPGLAWAKLARRVQRGMQRRKRPVSTGLVGLRPCS